MNDLQETAFSIDLPTSPQCNPDAQPSPGCHNGPLPQGGPADRGPTPPDRGPIVLGPYPHHGLTSTDPHKSSAHTTDHKVVQSQEMPSYPKSRDGFSLVEPLEAYLNSPPSS